MPKKKVTKPIPDDCKMLELRITVKLEDLYEMPLKKAIEELSRRLDERFKIAKPDASRYYRGLRDEIAG
jgi:hypothetical protein